MHNRKHNSTNPHQGSFKKVLCLCSAGLLRSPTAAVVLSQEPFNYNTRAAGMESAFALVPVDEVLLHWADEIVVMTYEQFIAINYELRTLGVTKTVKCLNIPDNYAYRDPELMRMIAERYEEVSAGS